MICRAWVPKDIISQEATLRYVMNIPQINVEVRGSMAVLADYAETSEFAERIRNLAYSTMTLNMWRKNWKGYYS